jgi:hypothetical protein
MEELTIILVKANTCGHCINFQKIFDKTIEVLNNRFKDYLNSIDTTKKMNKMSDFMEILKAIKYKELVGYKINFEIFDFDKNKNNDYKTEEDFKKSYGHIEEQVLGFPTVFIKLEDVDKKITISIIEHTNINTELEEDEQLQDAVDRFIGNIINEIKTIKSDSHIKITGGKTLKHKYEKYKHKLQQLNKHTGGNYGNYGNEQNNKQNNDYLEGYIKLKNEYLKSKK